MNAWPAQIIREDDDVLFEGAPRVRYTVKAIHEDKCWIQDDDGCDAIVDLARCIQARAFH